MGFPTSQVSDRAVRPALYVHSSYSTGQRILIHRTGEFTSGMCVVDRRGDQSTYAPGVNHMHVQEELKGRMATGASEPGSSGLFESVAVPALVEIEDEPSHLSKDDQEGIPVIEGTPGAEALLQIMMKRVWHVEADKESLTADLLLVQGQLVSYLTTPACSDWVYPFTRRLDFDIYNAEIGVNL